MKSGREKSKIPFGFMKRFTFFIFFENRKGSFKEWKGIQQKINK